jgi:cytochrome c oxidase subunit 3
MSRAVTARVGMAIFLGALAMMFAALLLAYAIVRARAPAWPPTGTPPLPRGVLACNTLLLVTASLALRRGRAGAALALGAAFLVAQALVWRGLAAAGLGPASGIYGSVFFALSGFHALHVLGGLVALAAVWARARRAAGAGAGAPAAAPALRLVATYWDFVLVVWLVLYLALCVR